MVLIPPKKSIKLPSNKLKKYPPQNLSLLLKEYFQKKTFRKKNRLYNIIGEVKKKIHLLVRNFCKKIRGLWLQKPFQNKKKTDGKTIYLKITANYQKIILKKKTLCI